MAKKPVKYSVVDAFTESPFKGNPAAVCFLEEDRDDDWLQALAVEFNMSETCYLTQITDLETLDSSTPRFRLRWFTPAAEVDLCGHATLAAAHFLFTSSLVNGDKIDFFTLSGVLSARKVMGDFIELEFPSVGVLEYNPVEVSLISDVLNGVSAIDLKKTEKDDIFVVFPSALSVVDFRPRLDEIRKCPGNGLIITAAAPAGSEFDFFSRYFSPKFGMNEDPVYGGGHCSLATYWSEKLGKRDFLAYAASPRGGIVNMDLDEQKKRVLLRGKAVTTMEGSVLV